MMGTQALTATVFLCQLTATALRAAILIKVDITDPSAVSLISTDAPSLVDDSSAAPMGGVVLLDLFNANSPTVYDAELRGTLEVTGTKAPMEWALNEGFGNKHLNLYASPYLVRPFMEFSTSFRAFAGVSVADLRACSFAPVGTTGTIRTEDIFFGNDVVIGEFEVVGDDRPVTTLRCQDGMPIVTGSPAWFGTEDTGIRLDAPTNNYGASTTLKLDGSTNDNMLIRFDLSSLSRSFTVDHVTSATLSLTVESVTNSGVYALNLFMIAPEDGGWLEGWQDGAQPPAGTGATYSHEVYDTTGWDGTPETYPVKRTTHVIPIVRTTFPTPPSPGDTVELHVYGYTEMELIRSWVEGGANGGFLISSTPTWLVRSREYPTVADRPKLTLRTVLGSPPVGGTVLVIR